MQTLKSFFPARYLTTDKFYFLASFEAVFYGFFCPLLCFWVYSGAKYHGYILRP